MAKESDSESDSLNSRVAPGLIGLLSMSLTIFHFSSKMSCEKGFAVKSQIFVLSMFTPLPNVKKLMTREKKQLHPIRDIRIASDQAFQYDLQKIPGTFSKKAWKKPFSLITKFTGENCKLLGN